MVPSTRAAVAAAALVLMTACHGRSQSPPASSAPRIELHVDRLGHTTVDVVGLPRSEVEQIERSKLLPEQWTALLRIVVASDGGEPADRPPVLGTYAIADGTLRFTPQFPFDPGERYHVVLDRSSLGQSRLDPASSRLPSIEAFVELPAAHVQSLTRVTTVYPSGNELPENLLRMYICFSAPMGLAGRGEHVHLLDESGRMVDDPFLPLDVNLWNEDRTRYTLLFDPGRVKTGIAPNEQMGRPLVAGHKYTLAIDQSWRDANGQPLVQPFQRQFRVGRVEDEAVDPAGWKVHTPGAGTTDPLTVSFPRPLDYALLTKALFVSTNTGEHIVGVIRVEEGETRWLFAPRDAWRSGEYRLMASSVLEDPAGNRIGRPFEREFVSRSDVGGDAKMAALPFRVVSGK